MNKRNAFFVLLLLILFGMTFGILEITETTNILDDYYEQNDRILLVDDNAPTNQNHNQICLDNEGGVISTWVDNRSGNYDIYAQRINKRGQKLWGDEGIPVCDDIYEQSYPTIIAD